MNIIDVAIVGAGVAGLTCAQQLAESKIKVAIFESEVSGGGLIINVNELSNFPPARGASGIEFAMELMKEDIKLGINNFNTVVHSVSRADERFEVTTDDGVQLAKIVVLATGGKLRKLNVPGEEEFQGQGVSYCADCDAPLMAGAKVVVVGSNQWAFHEVKVLARSAAIVYIVSESTVREVSTGTINPFATNPHVQFIPESRVEAIIGDSGGVRAVRILDASKTRELECTGVFPFIGIDPDITVAPSDVDRDASNALMVNQELETSIPGLFAIGYVRKNFGGWLKDAEADGRHAAAAIKMRLS